MSHTDKHALGATAHHDADTLANLSAIISDLTATYGGIRDICIGTNAQRTALVGFVANRFFYETDTKDLYRDTGAAWEAVVTDAGLAQRGLVNTGAQSFAGVKTFQSSPIVPSPSGGTDAANKTYVDNAVLGLLDYKGGYDATTDPNGAAAVGDTYTVTVEGQGVGGLYWPTILRVGDVIIAEVLNPASAADWTVVERNLDLADATTVGLMGITDQTFAGRKTFNTPVRMPTLNSGDEILTTDLDGDVQESGMKVTPAPAGGSGFTFVEYAVAPVNPPAGFVWIQAKDANTKTLNYYNGVTTFTVDLFA